MELCWKLHPNKEKVSGMNALHGPGVQTTGSGLKTSRGLALSFALCVHLGNLMSSNNHFFLCKIGQK